MSAFWSGHAGAAGGCCCSSGVRFGVGMLVPVQVAAASCCALAALAAGAAPGCRCRVPLQGAAAGCRCRVLLQGAACRVACAARRCRWTVPCRVRVQDTTVEGLSASQELGRARCVL